jgi:hypothetical protein
LKGEIKMNHQPKSIYDAAKYALSLGLNIYPLPGWNMLGVGFNFGEKLGDKEILDYLKKYPFVNVIVRCGLSNIMIIDVNIEDGKKGLDSLENLRRKHHWYDFNSTFTVKTPPGGLHYYFKLPKNSVVEGEPNNLGPGIKILAGERSEWLFGSRFEPGWDFDGDREIYGRYYILHNNKIQEAPNWLIDEAGNIIHPMFT